MINKSSPDGLGREITGKGKVLQSVGRACTETQGARAWGNVNTV